MSGDFIPHQDGAFLEWAKTLTSYVAAHLTGFNIQETALAPIQTLLADYQTAYDRAENPNRGKSGRFGKERGAGRAQSGAADVYQGISDL
ncbi:hypothetical protein [Treponema endosymbiont of Eucomonympha sp.]|uniref:hypothetical protein n=1 Tax=Treponema endosymbiont of Eucomonympha sp. TaxID=1580831 RepID=UPI0016504A42|nr:hypothetical protein [Treponema endosymbiont of Eucomonympha sp.]